MSCKYRGPYLPFGDTEWVCTTHNVELHRVAGVWGTSAKRSEMRCPVGEQAPNPYIYDPEKNDGADIEQLSSSEAYQAGVSAGLDARI
jgi:hypothetical protein